MRGANGEMMSTLQNGECASGNSRKTFMHCRLPIVRLLALFALAICAGQFADQLTQAGAFCDFGDSCEQVTSSVYGKPFGIPLPVFGLAGFGSLFAFTLVPKHWALLLVKLLAVVGAVIGIGLLIIQFAVLHNVCTLCFLIDSTSLFIAGISLVGFPEPAPTSKFRLLAWIMVAPVFVLIPIAWTAAMMPDTAPEEVQACWKDGEITIVEVTDFECPHCQKADGILREVLKNHKVRVVRLVAPMPSHENSKPAARAFIAARQQGKGDEMARELYEAESRTPPQCRELAIKLGLNLNDYDRAINDAKTEEEIRSTLTWTKKIKQGLPMIWVQNQFLKGTPTAEDLEEAIEKAKASLK